MKKVLIIFLVTSIPFGLIMGILSLNPMAGVMAGFSFGFLMALILGIINIVATKVIGGDRDTPVKQEKEIELRMPFNEAYKLCKQSILYIPGGKVTYENYVKGIVLGKTGVNIWTWGDKITMRIEKIDEETSKVHIQSKPAVATTVVDYGKNLKNIHTMSNYLQQHNQKSTL